MFKLGKVINFRGVVTYSVDNIGNVQFKLDKNGSVYDVNPRYIDMGGYKRDLLFIRGQNPETAAYNISAATYKWAL